MNELQRLLSMKSILEKRVALKKYNWNKTKTENQRLEIIDKKLIELGYY